MLGGFDAESFAIVEEGLDEFFGVIADAEVLGGCVSDDAVVYVGEIHYVSQAVAAKFQEAAQNVLENEGAVIADVGEVVDGGAAGVHGDFAGFFGDEGLGLVGERVVEMDFGSLRHFSGAKETTIVSDGWRKTNSLTESLWNFYLLFALGNDLCCVGVKVVEGLVTDRFQSFPPSPT